jgi:hypothetical protein
MIPCCAQDDGRIFCSLLSKSSRILDQGVVTSRQISLVGLRFSVLSNDPERIQTERFLTVNRGKPHVPQSRRSTHFW